MAVGGALLKASSPLSTAKRILLGSQHTLPPNITRCIIIGDHSTRHGQDRRHQASTSRAPFLSLRPTARALGENSQICHQRLQANHFELLQERPATSKTTRHRENLHYPTPRAPVIILLYAGQLHHWRRSTSIYPSTPTRGTCHQ